MLRNRTLCAAVAFGCAALAQATPAAAQEGAGAVFDRFSIRLSFDTVQAVPQAATAFGVERVEESTPKTAPPLRLGASDFTATRAFTLDRSADGWRASAAPFCDARCGDAIREVSVLVRTDEQTGMRVGALAGVSDRLPSFSGGSRTPNWYFFVAADAQAMKLDLRSRDPGTLRLNDMRLVGDAQAGVGTSVVGGDLAFGYVAREISHMGASRTEEFVGLTFAWSG